MAIRQSGQNRLVTFDRPEPIADITLDVPNRVYTLPNSGGLIPNDRFIYALLLQVELRLTIGTPATLTVMADAPYSLIDRVEISGYHRPRRATEKFFSLRGPEIAELARIYRGTEPLPVSSVPLDGTALATNDIRFFLPIPFTPLRCPMRQQMMGLLDAPNYDNLKIEIFYADGASVFDGTGTVALSAYGSASGSPRVRVSGYFALGGSGKFSGFLPFRTWRYFVERSSGDIVAGASQSPLFQIPKGYRIRALMLKTGVKGTGVSSGNNAYDSLSANILTNIRVDMGLNRSIRQWLDTFGPDQAVHDKYGLAPSLGYTLLDFAMTGSLSQALNTSNLVAGATGDTDLVLRTDISAGAGQAAVMAIEELRGVARRIGS